MRPSFPIPPQYQTDGANRASSSSQALGASVAAVVPDQATSLVISSADANIKTAIDKVVQTLQKGLATQLGMSRPRYASQPRNKQEYLKLIEDAVMAAAQQGVPLQIFHVGHGTNINGSGYLFLSDQSQEAKMPSEIDNKKLVSYADIFAKIIAVGKKQPLPRVSFWIEACHSGTVLQENVLAEAKANASRVEEGAPEKKQDVQLNYIIPLIPSLPGVVAMAEGMVRKNQLPPSYGDTAGDVVEDMQTTGVKPPFEVTERQIKTSVLISEVAGHVRLPWTNALTIVVSSGPDETAFTEDESGSLFVAALKASLEWRQSVSWAEFVGDLQRHTSRLYKSRMNENAWGSGDLISQKGQIVHAFVYPSELINEQWPVVSDAKH